VIRSSHVFIWLAVFISWGAVLSAESPESLYREMGWRMIGPFRGGRTRALAGVPGKPNVFYIGAVNGGVWKSDDYGRTWNPIFDNQETQSIGAIAVAASNPEIIYVACGEGLERPDLSVGNGIYKSRDGGKTWTHLGLEDAQQIPALAVNPRNPDEVFAAVLGHPYGRNPERGIFRSRDGGRSWQKVLYKDENTGGSDVEIDPENPAVVYAALWQSRLGPWEDNNSFAGAGGGLFKSTDGGNTWRKLSRGLPDDLAQVNVAVAASRPSRLYVTVSSTTPPGNRTDKGGGFFRSDDGGESWTRITTDSRAAMRIGGGDLAVPKVDPRNPDVVYSAGIVTVLSRDGGRTWESIRGAPGGDDYQNVWINPDHPSIILLTSDQGAVVSVNGGESWSSWYNQPTAQLYHVITTNTFPYKVCGAQQESGSVCISSRGNDGEITFRDWHPVGVIEYGYVAPDPLDSDIVYGAGRSEVSRFHWTTGQVDSVTPIPLRGKHRVDRTEPLVFSPVDPHRLYYAAEVLFETTDGGRSWQTISPDLTREHPGIPPSVGDQAGLDPGVKKQRGTIYSLAASFQKANTIWAGTDDGLVWITRDDGRHWNDITPPTLTPWSKVTQISASRFDDDTAYVSVSRFRIDDLRPHIYRTHDGGRSWQEITAGLAANAPVNSVREDPVRKGLLFAATEKAVWISFDDGDDWQPLQLNLPHTSMRDLWVHDNDLIVATHGRSFWVLDDITPFRQLSIPIARGETESSEPHIFDPAPAYRIRRDTNTDTPIPPDEPLGRNPPDGAILDYVLPRQVTAPLTLEILDGQGKLVRRYVSTDRPELSPEEQAKELIPAYWLRPRQAPATGRGMHRFVWDLRYPPPLASAHEYPIAAVPLNTPRYPLGPSALPGQYTVRLIAEGRTYTTSLAVKMDPRVKISSDELKTKFDLETRLASAVSESSAALVDARSLREQLEKLAQTTSALTDSVKELKDRISGLIDRPQDQSETSEVPVLTTENSNLLSLYKDVEKSDAPPTRAESEATFRCLSELRALVEHWNDLKTKDLANLNRQLESSGSPGIRLNSSQNQPDARPERQ
jgi:photosystem II stability/assembly factor-like uncharacterized protein